MKKQMRRVLAWLCCLCVMLTLAPSSGRAVLSGVYFTAINDQLLELTQETMPFWSEGKIYVSNAVFDEAYRKDLGISYSRSTDRHTVVLYTARSALYFVPSTGACYDNRGNNYEAKTVEKGNYIFFPLETICRFFGLTYSYNSTPLVPLVRIKNSAVVLSDSVFIDAATSYMRNRYNAYEKAVEQTQTPQPPTPPPEQETGASAKGQKIAVAVQVTDALAAKAVLEDFEQYDMQGTFLLTAEQIGEMPDLIRALVGGGHTLVLRPLAEEPEAAKEELLRGGEALWRAACVSTRMVCLSEKQVEMEESLTAAGYRLISFSVDSSERGVPSVSAAGNQLDRLATQHGDIILLLGEDTLCGGLGSLLYGLREGDYKVIGVR